MRSGVAPHQQVIAFSERSYVYSVSSVGRGCYEEPSTHSIFGHAVGVEGRDSALQRFEADRCLALARVHTVTQLLLRAMYFCGVISVDGPRSFLHPRLAVADAQPAAVSTPAVATLTRTT